MSVVSVNSYVNYLLQTLDDLAAAAKRKRLDQPGPDVGEILNRQFYGGEAEKLFAAARDEVAGNPVAAPALDGLRDTWADGLTGYVAVWQDGAHEPVMDPFCRALERLRVWLPTVASAKKTAGAAPAASAIKLVPITPEDETILMALANSHPTAKQAADVEAETGIPHKKMGERVEYLLKHRLIERPFGERSGLVIKDFGFRHISKRFAEPER